MSRQTLLTGEVIAETEDAILFEPDGEDRVWIPRSVLLDGFNVEKGDTDLECAEWFAVRAGLA